jgi:hypothetical protein
MRQAISIQDKPMSDPIILCPNCKTEVKLTESLAAPLVASIRKQYEQRLGEKDAEVAKREESLRQERAALARAKETLGDQVAATLQRERVAIVAEEAKKARLLLAGDLENKTKELADLQEVLKQRDDKLAEAQKAQAELIRKQREIDDAKREMDLTIETRIQESLDAVREKARLEAEELLKLKSAEMESARKQLEKQMAEKDTEITKRENSVREHQAALAIERETLDSKVAEKIQAERAAIVAEESKRARLLLAADIENKSKEVADLQEVLKQRDEKLAEAQKAQAELIRKQRELDDARREIDLTIETRVHESLGAVQAKAKREAEDSLKLKVQEKEQTISAMQRQIEELKRKAEQGSQQLQGEVQEADVESQIRAAFPIDIVEPVAKGEHGGDVLHRVAGPIGQCCGTMLWESKRTKNWSDGWLPKLRDDQRAAKAEIALIVTQTLPKGIDSFGFIDGVWVTSPRYAIPIAIALRQSLIAISAARKSSEGQQTKMEMLYSYLTGPNFGHRISAIVEKFSDLHKDLAKERKMMTRLWAKREGQIRCVIESTAGMYGDLQGIAGRTLKDIEGLGLPALELSSSPDGVSEG